MGIFIESVNYYALIYLLINDHFSFSLSWGVSVCTLWMGGFFV